MELIMYAIVNSAFLLTMGFYIVLGRNLESDVTAILTRLSNIKAPTFEDLLSPLFDRQKKIRAKDVDGDLRHDVLRPEPAKKKGKTQAKKTPVILFPESFKQIPDRPADLKKLIKDINKILKSNNSKRSIRSNAAPSQLKRRIMTLYKELNFL